MQTSGENREKIRSEKETEKQKRFQHAEHKHRAVTIAVDPQRAFSFFRDFKNLSLFMKDLKTVDVLSIKRSRWVVEVKGLKAEWEADITEERPGEMISWRSLEGSEVDTRGSIWFSPAPQNRGTVVSLELEYKVPGGKLTELVTKMSGEDPDALAFINLRRLKCFLETGEIATVDGQPSGRDESAEKITLH